MEQNNPDEIEITDGNIDELTDGEKLLLALGMDPNDNSPTAQRLKDKVRPAAANDEELARYAAERNRARTAANAGHRQVVAKTIQRGIRKVSGFGMTQESEGVERKVTHDTGGTAAEATRKRLDEQLQDPKFLVEATGGDKEKIKAITSNQDDIKKLRDQLSDIFTVGSTKNHLSELDGYIEGIEDDGAATRNNDAGNSGVRIKFKGKAEKTADEGNKTVKTAQKEPNNDGNPLGFEENGNSSPQHETDEVVVERLLNELRKHKLTQEQLKSLEE